MCTIPTTRRTIWFGLVLLAVALLPRTVGAQRLVAVKGIIREDSTLVALPNAEVRFVTLGRGTLTDSAGRFLLPDLPAGSHRLLVRRVGYQPLEAMADLAPIDTLELTLHLTPVPTRLATLESRGTTPSPPARFREFEERRRGDHGAFLTREDLDRRSASRFSDILRGIPGLRLTSRNGTVTYLGSGRASVGEPPCWAQVIVDGALFYDPTTDQGSLTDPPNLDGFSPRELEAVEYYRGTADVPVQYLSRGAICGTLVLWSRSR